ncbi:ABC transporter permease [Lacticaseibacillus parakribbianus]|uniref:ABC transporter permease n=1 Tax=Lacticaseibacillus parakribbianus TaxID=2970927 RepID=UPI0021CB10F6|nr:ABC transporter permease [Lacticaseibacillus parakribbianus]
MKKYLFFRILRSLVSIFLVTTLSYIIIYSLVPRSDVLKDDPNIRKLLATPDKYIDYQNNAFQKMNYIEYKDTKSLIAAVKKDDKKTATTAHTAANKALFDAWAKKTGYTIQRFKRSKDYYATRELSIFERLGRFYGRLIQIDTPWAIHDKSNPGLKRYLKIQKDPLVGWALVGSGTKYRYQIYFNDKFPYIHQNFLKFDLGISYPTYAGNQVSQVIGGGQGQTVAKQYKINGQTLNLSNNVYTRAYQKKSQRDEMTYDRFKDDYTSTTSTMSDPSMIGTSFRAGMIALVIQYLIAIPMAILMARYKGRLFDRIGTAIVTAFIAIPSLAFIFAFRYVGANGFGLPGLFPTYGAGDIRSWILPSVILGLLGVSGLVIWFRRYMIDQQQSDYVNFARAKGLNEGEIYRKHIFKNASIPIVNGIPGSIIGLIGGATITEQVFAMPGMGKMLPTSILAHNNTVVIALVFIFTTIGVLSVLLGDLLMVVVDPRIKLTTSGDD